MIAPSRWSEAIPAGGLDPLPRIPDGQGIEHKAHADQEIVIHALVGQANDIENDDHNVSEGNADDESLKL